MKESLKKKILMGENLVHLPGNENQPVTNDEAKNKDQPVMNDENVGEPYQRGCPRRVRQPPVRSGYNQPGKQALFC